MKLITESNIKEGILTIGGIIIFGLTVLSCSSAIDSNNEKKMQEYLKENAYDYVLEHQYNDIVYEVESREGSYEDGYNDGYKDGYDDGTMESE